MDRTPDGTLTARPRRHVWAQILGIGFALWALAVAVTLITRNPALIPSLILLGSFLIPVTFVTWAFERWRDEDITTERIVLAFVVGGMIGVLGASVLEAFLLHPSPWLFGMVGLIEEAVKLGALVIVARGVPRRHARDGIVLGAAVGFGFAAFESAGYAFNSLFTVHGLSLTSLVQTELLRGVLAPVGHGLWTAILGGVLFWHARGGRFRITGAVIITYLWVSLLHALWDSMQGIALTLTLLITGAPWQVRLLAVGYLPTFTPEQDDIYTALSIGGLGFVAVLGAITLAACWRRYRDPAAQARVAHHV